MSKDILSTSLKNLGISIDVDYDKFEVYYEMLKEWNEKIDLTNIIDREEVYIKHFLDSLTPFMIEDFKGTKKLIDIGTGAGFPGIPLKLVNDGLEVTLLDSLNKRLIFLDQVIDNLKLEGIRTVHGRSENAGQDPTFRENYDIAISRAVSRLNKLVELTPPLVKVGGIMVAMKAKDYKDEVEEADRSIRGLGGRIRDIITFNLVDEEHQRALIIIEKVSKTNKKYPRPYGKIKNKPL